MRNVQVLIAAVVMLPFASSALGQNPDPGRGRLILEAVTNLNLREEPPHGFFYTLGESISVVPRGRQVTFLEEKTIRTFLGDYQWVKVVVPPGKPGDVELSGWVYRGNGDKPPYLKEITPTVVPSMKK